MWRSPWHMNAQKRGEGEGEMNSDRNRPWTPEEESRLRTLVEEGTSAMLIAAKLKRTVAAIRGRLEHPLER